MVKKSVLIFNFSGLAGGSVARKRAGRRSLRAVSGFSRRPPVPVIVVIAVEQIEEKAEAEETVGAAVGERARVRFVQAKRFQQEDHRRRKGRFRGTALAGKLLFANSIQA